MQDFLSLADGGRAESTPISNDGSGELYFYADLFLSLGAMTARDSGWYIEVYIVIQETSEWAVGDTGLTPSAADWVANFVGTTTSSGAINLALRHILLPPRNFKFILINNTGQAFTTSSGFFFKYSRYNIQST
jgi:hypothetical protein